MSYCTIQQFQQRYDLRSVAQLSNDQNADTLNTTNAQAALDDATAEINTAALQGSQYQLSDLTSLVAAGDTQLVRLNADLAYRNLLDRRGQGLPPGLEARIKSSESMLDALRSGARILNVTTNRVADVPALVTRTADQDLNLGVLTGNDFFAGPTGTITING